MKRSILLVMFLGAVLVAGACVPTSPAVPISPLAEDDATPPGNEPSLADTGEASPTTTSSAALPGALAGTITATVSLTDTAMLSPTLTVTAPLSATATVSPTATISPTVVPTGSPIAPTDTPTPGEPQEPTPTDTPTPQPPPTSTPTATATEGPPPTPTALPNAVFVRDHSSIRRGSDVLVVGEITNGASNPVYNVTVSAAFRDANGNLIGASEAPAFLPETLRTQNNPFKIVLANAPSSFSTYELALRWDELTAQGYDRITIASQEVIEEPTLRIQGDVRNDGFGPISNIVVAVSFYDAAGHVLDAYRGSVNAPVAPGSSSTFEIETGRSDLAFDHFLVQAQGVLAR